MNYGIGLQFAGAKQRGGGGAAPTAGNGLSIDATGKIVLGNDSPGTAAALTSTRLIPLAGNLLLLNDGTTSIQILGGEIDLIDNANNYQAIISTQGNPKILLNSTSAPPVIFLNYSSNTANNWNVQNNAGVLNFNSNVGGVQHTNLQLNASSRLFQIGDISNAGGGLFLKVNDVSNRIDIDNLAHNANLFLNFAGSNVIQIQPAQIIISGFSISTLIQAQVSAAGLTAILGAQGANSSCNELLQLKNNGITNATIQIVGPTGTNNSIYITAPLVTGAPKVFELNFTTFVYRIGDYGSVNNGTAITLNDSAAASTITMTNKVGNVTLVLNGRMSINSTDPPPTNTTTPAQWVNFQVGGTTYKVPLYL